MSNFDFDEIKRVCQTCAVAGLKAICEANTASPKPTKFVYMSAEGTPQDLTKKPFMMGDYQIMRVSLKTTIFLYAYTDLFYIRAKQRRLSMSWGQNTKILMFTLFDLGWFGHQRRFGGVCMRTYFEPSTLSREPSQISVVQSSLQQFWNRLCMDLRRRTCQMLI